MSDEIPTPRTDAMCGFPYQYAGADRLTELVPAYTSRALERELANARNATYELGQDLTGARERIAEQEKKTDKLFLSMSTQLESTLAERDTLKAQVAELERDQEGKLAALEIMHDAERALIIERDALKAQVAEEQARLETVVAALVELRNCALDEETTDHEACAASECETCRLQKITSEALSAARATKTQP